MEGPVRCVLFLTHWQGPLEFHAEYTNGKWSGSEPVDLGSNPSSAVMTMKESDIYAGAPVVFADREYVIITEVREAGRVCFDDGEYDFREVMLKSHSYRKPTEEEMVAHYPLCPACEHSIVDRRYDYICRNCRGM